MFTTETLVLRTTQGRSPGCTIPHAWALQRKAGCLWDHQCKFTCKRDTKANHAEVLPCSNFYHAILTIPSIPFIPVHRSFLYSAIACPASVNRTELQLREKFHVHPLHV